MLVIVYLYVWLFHSKNARAHKCTHTHTHTHTHTVTLLHKKMRFSKWTQTSYLNDWFANLQYRLAQYGDSDSDSDRDRDPWQWPINGALKLNNFARNTGNTGDDIPDLSCPCVCKRNSTSISRWALLDCLIQYLFLYWHWVEKCVSSRTRAWKNGHF